MGDADYTTTRYNFTVIRLEKKIFDEFMEQTVYLYIPGSNLSLAVKVEEKNTLAQ